MSRLFEFKLSQASSELLPQAKAMAQANGVRLVGDDLCGRFSGLGVEGEYRVTGDRMAIRIQKKPFIMPWSLIESTFKSFFV